MQVLAFEDVETNDLRPITSGRPALTISVASFRLVDLLRQLSEHRGAHLRPHLREIFAADFRDFRSPKEILSAGRPVLLVCARLVPSADTLAVLRRLISDGKPGIVWNGGCVAAMVVRAEDARSLSEDVETLRDWIRQRGDYPSLEGKLEVLRYPHEVIAAHMRLMPAAMQTRLSTESWQQLQDGVFVREGVQIGPHAVFDTSSGPILLDEKVKVGRSVFCVAPSTPAQEPGSSSMPASRTALPLATQPKSVARSKHRSSSLTQTNSIMAS